MKLCSWEIKKLIIQFKPFLALMFLLLAACILFWQRASGEGDGGFVYAQYREIGADYRSGKLNWEEVKKCRIGRRADRHKIYQKRVDGGKPVSGSLSGMQTGTGISGILQRSCGWWNCLYGG